MLIGFQFFFWWPYQAGIDDEAEQSSERLLTYLQSLAELEPSFAELRLPSDGDWCKWKNPSRDYVQEMVQQQYMLLFSNGDADIGYRSVGYAAGSPTGSATTISVVGDDELLMRSHDAAEILAHGIRKLPVTEAGASYIDESDWHFWRRWIKSERSETPIPNIPFEPGWASEEALLDGTLYIWPEWEPAKLIAQQ